MMRRQPAETTSSPTPRAGADAAPVRVLLIDDDPFDAELFEYHLRRAGLAATLERVGDAAAFRTALEGAAAPDLVLADVLLPGFGALDALAILRESASTVPLIAMAAVSREEAIVDALRAGAVDYLFKHQVARLPLAVRAAVERARLLGRLEEKRRNLARLSLQLVTTQENERKALARELHDELGQRLTVLNLLLYRLQPAQDDADGQASWQQAERELAGMVEQVRGMSVALRPPALDYSGLEAAAGQMISRMAGAAGLRWTLEYAGVPAPLPAPVEMTVYRLVQESLTNIVRHARAGEVIVEINGGEHGAEIEVIVRDDGAGFDPARPDLPGAPGSGATTGGSGLWGMRERVELLGGSFEIDSAPGAGTRIAATIPLDYTLNHEEDSHEHPAG
jgi:signal transduction histidine kinase